jgi:hypothetical protein
MVLEIVSDSNMNISVSFIDDLKILREFLPELEMENFNGCFPALCFVNYVSWSFCKKMIKLTDRSVSPIPKLLNRQMLQRYAEVLKVNVLKHIFRRL